MLSNSKSPTLSEGSFSSPSPYTHQKYPQRKYFTDCTIKSAARKTQFIKHRTYPSSSVHWMVGSNESGEIEPKWEARKKKRCPAQDGMRGKWDRVRHVGVTAVTTNPNCIIRAMVRTPKKRAMNNGRARVTDALEKCPSRNKPEKQSKDRDTTSHILSRTGMEIQQCNSAENKCKTWVCGPNNSSGVANTKRCKSKTCKPAYGHILPNNTYGHALPKSTNMATNSQSNRNKNLSNVWRTLDL